MRYRSELKIGTGGCRTGNALDLRALACERGSTVVEFALLAPILIMLLTTIAAYGGYFYMAHTVQEVANDAARAAAGGLTSSERLSLANQAVAADLQANGLMTGAMAAVQVADGNGQNMTVAVIYNAAGDLPYSVQSLVPMPSSVISRAATISLGGY